MRISLTFLRSLAATLCMVAVAGANAEERFLEGFPDVPLLPGVRGIDGESVFFDTPSGTIAEVKLLIEGGGDKVMEKYAESLAGLGWACEKLPQSMRCTRNKNRLVFFDTNPKIKNGKLILRLEPVG